MTRDQVWAALVAAVEEEIGDGAPIRLAPEMTAADVPGWDSLAHVRIVLNAEDRTRGRIDIKATYRAATMGDLCDILLAHAG